MRYNARMDKICGIYKITNLINGKAYIGQSVNILSRFDYHKKRCNNNYLRASFEKYGIDNFSFEIIRTFSISPLLYLFLDAYEEHYINFYNTMNRDHGYNRMHGGQPGRLCEEAKELMKRNSAGKLIGHKHTSKAIEHMKKAQSNRSAQWKKHISEGQKGKIISENTKEKIRIARSKQVITEETKAKLSKALTGKKKSPEHIQKVQEAYQKFLQSEEGIAYKKAMSEKMKNRKISQETRNKISAAAKQRKVSDATRKKHSDAMKGRIVSDETRAKMKIAMQKRIDSGEMSKPRKPHSDETKAKMSKIRKDYYKRLKELAEEEFI